MKKFILFLFSILVIAALSAESSTQHESQEVKLEKEFPTKGSNTQTRPRTFCFLQSFYDADLGVIEILHESLGDTDVYILDSSGQIICHESLYSSGYSILYIEVPSECTAYSIVIDSQSVYAYGVL